jgi:3-dehydroquinate dehydratase type I
MIPVYTITSENYSWTVMKKCRMIEARLDCLPENVVERLIEIYDGDIIFTCRRRDDGGNFEGDEEERLRILSRYVMYADYMDIEHDVGDDFIDSVKKAGVKVIESYHSCENPGYEYLQDIIENRRGDIFKVAVPGKSKEDVKMILKLHLEYENLIAFLIGKEFSYTRIISALIGFPIIYCHDGKSSAPGQLSVEDVIRIRKAIGSDF